MFLMIGMTNGQKDLPFRQPVVCEACGRYGAYEVFMTYTQLLLFFIPCFRWNRQYFVRMSCCGTIYTLDPEVGRRIERGEQMEIRPEDLVRVSGPGTSNAGYHRCSSCGYETTEDFAYCPKCGQRF